MTNLQEIDGTNPDNTEYLDWWVEAYGNYLPKIKKQGCVNCQLQYYPEHFGMFVLCTTGTTRWWHCNCRFPNQKYQDVQSVE